MARVNYFNRSLYGVVGGGGGGEGDKLPLQSVFLLQFKNGRR